MKKSDTERDVLTFAGELMRKFYTKNDFSSFIESLSRDAFIVLKSGKIVEGKDNIETTFADSVFFPCNAEKEEASIKELGENLYLAHIITALTSSDFIGTKNARADLILRANDDGKAEVVSLLLSQFQESSLGNNVFPVDKKLPRRTKGAAREEVLINFILDGLSNKEIAKRLSLAEITIKKALSKIYQRFNVKNRGELLAKISKKQ